MSLFDHQAKKILQQLITLFFL